MGKKKPIVSSLGQWAYPGEVTIIPSNSITMKGVGYPVLGVDNLGNSQMMIPGADYTFPGDYVTEYPQMQFGGMSKRKIDKILNQNKDLNFVQRMYQPNTPSIIIPGQPYPATHFMESADGRVYPTVVQMPDGSLQYLGDNAYNYANQTGEYIEFPNDRQARRFAKNYKKGTGVLEEFGKGGLTQWFAEEWTDVKTGKPCGRSGKEKGSRPYPACRPKKRVNETTPKTTSEMSSAEKARFKREKTSGKRIDYNHKRRQLGGQEDSTMENIAEFFDPTGYTSWDDANRAYNEWKKSNSVLPSMSQALDMFGAVPALGKFGKLKYLDPNSIKTAYKAIPWQQILNAFDTAEDEISKTKKKYGGWLEQYQEGGFRYTPPPRRAFTTSYQQPTRSTSDNTRVVTPNVSDATRAMVADQRAREAAAKRSGVIYAGTPESDYEKAKRAASFVEQSIEKDGFATPLDYVLDFVNPATYAFAATDLVGNTVSAVKNVAQGNFQEAGSDLVGAGMNALYLLPAKGVAKAIASPMAFRPVEGMMYRGLGKEGFRDAMESGVFRPKQLNYSSGRSFAEKANSPKQFSSTYYAPSKKFGVVENYGSEYVAEVPYNEADFFRRYSKRNDWSYSTPRQIPITEGRILKKDWLLGYKPIDVPSVQPATPQSFNPALSGFVPDITNTRLYKGAFQKYPKGPLTQEEITAFKNSPAYLKSTKEQLNFINQYGDSWKLPNYMDEALATQNRNYINPELYGGNNWGKSDYIIAGLFGAAYPAVASLYGLAFSPPAVKNRVLKNVGIQGPAGGLSSRDTTIDITNALMDFAKVNEVKDGNIIIGGEFIEDANNTVRKAKDWLSATDTYSDKKYPSKDIQSFYGVENGKFKVGKANEFNPDTEIVPRRFGEANISKAVLNGKEMRLLDNKGNPIYQNTPNTGKFILYSPSTGKSQFTYINDGKTGVTKVNDFLKKNKDAQYIHLDNGRYEYYGLNPEGLSKEDYQNYYEQDLKREGNPGYNLIIKGKGGQTNWLEQYQEGGESDIRMEPIEINAELPPWYIRYPRKALRAIDNKLTDWGAQYSKRISDATGGKDWYKEANPFGSLALEFINAPQYAATYGVTGKVQTPSEAMDIQNPYGAFAVDALLDPMNVVGVGVSSKARNLFSQVPDQLNSSIARQINKNPGLALSLQRGRPINTSNVNVISGIKPGDVSAFPDMVKRINPNTVSEIDFFKQLEKGAGSLDSSLQKRISDLESKEGFKRLVDQEKDYLFYNTDLPEDTIERVAKINARSRIDELKNITNVNKEAAEFASINFLNTGRPNKFVETSRLYDNAFYAAGYDDILSDTLSKRQGINLVKPTPNYSKSVPGEIGIGYNYIGNRPIEMHEIAHSLQRGRKLSVDDQLRNITPKKQLSADQQKVYNYFTKGSGGVEPSAFANELRESMLQKGFIPDYYSPISQQQVQDAYTYFKKNPIGTYDKNTGKFLSTTRIFDFMDATKSNSKLLSDILNKLPAVTPIGIGAAGVAQLPEQKYGGWLDSYQDGGEKLPELNSKIDVANFYKNPLSNKYGIAFNPKTKGYEYYLKSQDVVDNIEPVQEKERTLEIPNISSKDLKDLNKKLNFLPGAQDYIEMTSPVLNPEIRQRLAKEMLLDEISSFSTDPITVEDPSLNIANQTLQELLKQEERSKPIPKYNSLPNKQKPIKAALNKNIELNPVQKYYADRMYEKYGKVIITDKATNTTFYGVRKPDGTWDLNNFEVLTGQNPNFNEISNLSVSELAKVKDKRGTPIGVFNIQKAADIYGYPGIRLDNTGNIAYHVTYKGPDDLYRSALYNNNNILDNYRSYGCINCEKPSLEGLLKFANPNDKALIINSKLGFKNNLEWIKKNSPELYKELFKEKGGQTGWLNKYK